MAHCNRFLRSLKKDQGHPIAHRNPNQLTSRFTFAELRSFSYQLVEFLHHFALLVDEQL